jgi:pimeloyl-ACP methyl ester carboxylesterase
LEKTKGNFDMNRTYIKDVTPGFDFKNSFSENGMGKVFFQGEGRQISEWGKIAMWAYGGSRVVDYLMTRDDIDKDCISVAGHSRLGKTALWCAAQDERIFAGLVNCSGFGGAGLMVGLARDKFKTLAEGCQIEWWCEKAKEYQEDATLLPYDAHFIVGAIAPRYVNILSADGDMTRYQLADFMSAAAASPAFENLGLKGFVSDEELPHPTVVYNEGHIGYALRPGSHFFSRWDWNRHMEFVLKHRKTK